MKPLNARSVVALLVALGGAIAALFVLNGCSRGAGSRSDVATTPAPIPPCGEGWESVWSDNFDGSGNVDANGLNVDNWTIETGLCVNNEQQTYVTDTMSVRVENGALVIEAHDADPTSQTCPGCYGDRFTSGRIITKGKQEFQYGRFEARIRLPVGEGLWPAFWLLGANIDEVGWPQCGELDILENLGYENWVSGAVHGPGYSGADGVGYTYTLPAGQAIDDWHVYRADWHPNSIQWYVDGKLVRTRYKVTSSVRGQQWVFDHPFFIVLNLALGGDYPYAYNDAEGSDGGCYGLPRPAIDILPQRMEVDWVRVCARPALP